MFWISKILLYLLALKLYRLRCKYLNGQKRCFLTYFQSFCVTAMLLINKIPQNLQKSNNNEMGFWISLSFLINNKNWTFKGFEPRASMSPPLLSSFLSFFLFFFFFFILVPFCACGTKVLFPPLCGLSPPEPSSSSGRVRLFLEAGSHT